MKRFRRAWTALAMGVLIAGLTLVLPGCGQTDSDTGDAQSAIDYMALVNKENPLPEGWEEEMEIVTMTASQDWEVKVEKTAYDAYLELKEDLEKQDVHVDLDSAYRSTEEQQDIWDRFMEEYGEAYTKKYVAVPGCSEHQTGLALDLYLNIDGEDVYKNEEMVKYPEVWEKIHENLAEHGFILRYLKGKMDITGYAYEPWHIRYIGDTDAAKKIMEEGITLEEYLDRVPETAAAIDLGESRQFTEADMDEAVRLIKTQFEEWDGCTLGSITYAGDESNSEENLRALNEQKEDAGFTECMEFLMDFHSPTDDEDLEGTAWEKDTDYEDYQWWLARAEGGEWQLVSWGY